MTSYQKGYTFYASLPVSYPEAKLQLFQADCAAKGDTDNAAYWAGALQATRDHNNRKPAYRNKFQELQPQGYQADIDLDTYLDRYDY